MDGAEMFRKGTFSSYQNVNTTCPMPHAEPFFFFFFWQTYTCDGMRQTGLATAGRAVEEHAAWRLDAGVEVHFRVGQRHRNQFHDLFDTVLNATQVGQACGGDKRLFSAFHYPRKGNY